MSTQDFNKKTSEAKKIISGLRKDIKFREDQATRGQTTYSIDAQIRGQFSEIDGVLQMINKMVTNYINNPKDYGIAPKDAERRKKQYQQLTSQKNSLKRVYDSFFQKKANNQINSSTGQQSVDQKYNTKNMTTKQLAQLKQKQQKQQDQAIDGLIDTVRNIKGGGKAISNQLDQQKVMLGNLEDGLDQNTENMGAVKKKMMKLLDSSSNCCLITVIIIEIAAVVAIFVAW